MKYNFALLCDNAFIPSQGGKPNFTGVFGGITASLAPAVQKDLYIVFNFSPEDVELHKLVISIKSPSKGEIYTYEVKLGPAISKNEALGHILRVSNLKLEEIGVHSIDFLIDGNLLHTLDFNFSVNKK
ncbi:MAG: hypothetical protein WC297_01085 [Candidatus Paceibacterota bacterium]|jgi:hypothetical protein